MTRLTFIRYYIVLLALLLLLGAALGAWLGGEMVDQIWMDGQLNASAR